MVRREYNVCPATWETIIHGAARNALERQCANFEIAERDCVRRTSRSATAGLRPSRALPN